MGMDCVPKNNVKPFRVNWIGWTFLGQVLALSGADISKMSGTNNGGLVDAETARAWAKALRGLLARKDALRLKIAVVPHRAFRGKRAEVPVVEFTRAPAEERIYMKLKDGAVPSILDQVKSFLGVDILFGYCRPTKRNIKIVELDKETRDFIEEFARFCERSGGFEQW